MKFEIAKKNLILYSFAFFMAVSFLIFIYIYDQANDTRQQQSVYAVREWNAYTVTANTAKTIVSGTVQIDASTGNILAFYSAHQNIKVYAQDRLIYQYPVINNNPLAKSPGYCWNLLQLPFGTITLKIEISSPYSADLNTIRTFYIGNNTSVPAYILSESLIPFLLCVIMFVMGVVFITYHIILSQNAKAQVHGKLLKLGVFSLFLSVWSINECHMTTFVMKNSIMTSYLSFIALMLLPYPFAKFVRTFYEDNSRIWEIFCQIDIIHIFVCFLLQITGVCDFRQSLWSTHAMLVILSLIIFLRSYRILREGISKHVVKTHLFCICICIASLLVDMFCYYIGTTDANTFGRIGFLCYIVIMGIASTLESASLIKKGEEASAYERLAYTDQMTGLNNRTCFNVDFEKLSHNPVDIGVVDFDLNNLKLTNDTLGHSAGDRYIKNCAAIISEIFDGIGTCYRVGGDEFVAIVRHASNIDMKQYLAMLEACIDASNKEHKNSHMQIAYGYAVYSPDIDKNLEDTYNRADKIMYHDKKAKKNLFKNNQ